MESCSLCRRDTPDVHLEKHHLKPHSKDSKDTIQVCCDCGDQLHILFTNNELRDKYNTVEALRSNERVRGWIKWIRKKPAFGYCMKEKKKR
jgi:hypothetical protein